tara:strand:- start:1590 stop:2345 length:756 start_codon:yes stop_codon:yes gene_type:complete
MCDAARQINSEELEVGGLFKSNSNIIKNKDINENNTSNFMLSLWFYIDNWGNAISKEKNIMYMSTNHTAKTVDDLQTSLSGISKKVSIDTTNEIYKNINVCLDKYENNLFIDVETYQEKPSDKSSNFTRYKISNIPIQKWNNLTISIDTRTLDVYLDGKLVNSFILHGLYKNKNDNNRKKNMYLGNMGNPNIGFEGFITRIRYEPMSINPQEAFNIYKDGINASLAKTMFNKYRLKVSFLEYNKEKGSFVI